jgi:hypothetical protein
LNTVVTDPEEIAKIIGKTPEEIAKRLTGDHTTKLEWVTLIPPFPGLPPGEPLTISLAYTGDARLFPSCDKQLELGMQLGVRSQSKALDLDASAKFVSHGKSEGRISAVFPLAAPGAEAPSASKNVADWRKEVNSVSRLAATDFRVELELVDDVLTGRFSVLGGTGATCHMALWPADRPCELGEHLIDGHAPFRGLLAEHIIEELKKFEKPQKVRWEDTGAVAQMQISFSPDPGLAVCVGGDVSDPTVPITYGLLGLVGLVTDDGRLDVSLPARASTRGLEGDWGPIELGTNGLAKQSRPGKLPAPKAPGANELSLLDFSSPHAEMFSNGDTFIAGSVGVSSLDLHSPRVKTKGGSCSAGDFMGRLTPITSASYQ